MSVNRALLKAVTLAQKYTNSRRSMNCYAEDVLTRS